MRTVIHAVFAFSVFAGGEGSADNPTLDWMVGHWCMEKQGTTTEELWLRPAGDVMVGLGRTRTPAETTGFEYLRIVEENGVQSFVAQPGGKPATRFAQTGSGTDWVRFENPEHDFPQRIEYRRDGGKLQATASGPGEAGTDNVFVFNYTPCESVQPSIEDIEVIKSLRIASNQAIARHDAEAVASFLDEDYVITISTGAIERSREAAVESFAAHFAEFPDVVYVRTPSDITVSEAYPLAIEYGTWTGTRTGHNGPLENGGKYTASWRKVDGAWKIHSELFVGLYCSGADC